MRMLYCECVYWVYLMHRRWIVCPSVSAADFLDSTRATATLISWSSLSCKGKRGQKGTGEKRWGRLTASNCLRSDTAVRILFRSFATFLL